MSDTPAPAPRPEPAPLPPRGWSCLGVAFGLSLLFNLVALGGIAVVCAGFWFFGGRDGSSGTLKEQFHSGNKGAKDKIAVVEVAGVLMEGLLGHAHRQIDAAARDRNVKAVVLRVNSPGGSITASDDLHHRLVRMRDGKAPGSSGPKPVVVSMASLAASGGYYISMPARTLFAEPTTVTGSIGVYAALPNVKELGEKVGFKMIVIKRGDVKDGGSPFKEMEPQEREVWEDMIGDAYERFLAVVAEGRKEAGLTRKALAQDAVVREMRKGKDGKEFEYVRRRADGGIFTAEQARRFGLVDRIGYLEEAVAEAATAAGLGDDYRVVRYERPFALTDLLLGVEAKGAPAPLLDAGRLSAGLTPRLWYLAPQNELAGLAAAMQPPP